MDITRLQTALETLRDIDPEMMVSEVIALLAVAQSEDMTLGDLQDRATLTGATASRYVSTLSKAWGLVERIRDPVNARKVRINLTAKGRNFVNRLLKD